MSNYHFIGIGGIGMSALAKILLKRGSKVQGSDPSTSYVTEGLKKSGAQVFSEHSPSHLSAHCSVVYSTAIKREHPEYQAALHQKLPLLHRSELLAELMQGYRSLLVTGTHGKTTTSSLLAHVLEIAALKPTFALGGIAVNFGSNGDQGEGDYFVAEADESDGSFLKYPAYGAIITNLEEEHLDHWKTGEALIRGFRDFAAQVTAMLWWCADDPTLSSLQLKGKSYGFSPMSDLLITKWHQSGWKVVFDLAYQGKVYEGLELPLLGQHNVSNAAAVFGLALDLGIAEGVIRTAFKTFKGVKRRLEKKGNKTGAIFYDDYAHHPTEIIATLKGVRRAAGERRVVAIFQPHRFSRLRTCWSDFIHAFKEVDVLFITDVYAAGEEPIPGIDALTLTKEIQTNSPFPVIYTPRKAVVETVASSLHPHDIVITMGAGDVTEVCSEILQKEVAPFRLALIQGGKSAEHEVSLRSGKVLRDAMNPSYYKLHTWTISKEGTWFLEGQKKELPEVVAELLKCDVVFPALHGPFGEDGMIQAFLETLGLAYAGSDYRSSVVSMDKAWTKHLAARQGVEVARFLEFSTYEWEYFQAETLQTILKQFSYPFYVKAVHLGSTIGVHRVKSEQDLFRALEDICQLDYRFLVEDEVHGREMEFGFIGNYDVAVSDAAEVPLAEELNTYANKYTQAGLPSIPKAPLPPQILAQGKDVAKKVYQAIGCSGLARIDFFLKADGTWVLNEVNPMPGCTPTSVYPVIWKAEGVDLDEVIDRVVIAGLHRKRYQDRHLRPPKTPPVDL